ncbi:hypothetical protein E2986_01843 [Frieseomelitta varia]|uniref:Seven-in-absentia protein TRAF-like domain-containing protein n=1 Tax=Frieseomelitta varia TaxID=561572 RepID=A0A833SLF0_9HYME|nr:hypothetical protein E2986_01843 [Frieseomelitta varia]
MSMFVFNRLELNGHKRRLTWEAMPRSIHEGVSSAILNSDCLINISNMAVRKCLECVVMKHSDQTLSYRTSLLKL